MDLVVSLLALFLFCSALTAKLRLNASVAPLVSICAIQLVLILFGICGLLPVRYSSPERCIPHF